MVKHGANYHANPSNHHININPLQICNKLNWLIKTEVGSNKHVGKSCDGLPKLPKSFHIKEPFFKREKYRTVASAQGPEEFRSMKFNSIVQNIYHRPNFCGLGSLLSSKYHFAVYEVKKNMANEQANNERIC